MTVLLQVLYVGGFGFTGHAEQVENIDAVEQAHAAGPGAVRIEFVGEISAAAVQRRVEYDAVESPR
jgi:hypothetical protein